jgi:hypothetical protein
MPRKMRRELALVGIPPEVGIIGSLLDIQHVIAGPSQELLKGPLQRCGPGPAETRADYLKCHSPSLPPGSTAPKLHAGHSDTQAG